MKAFRPWLSVVGLFAIGGLAGAAPATSQQTVGNGLAEQLDAVDHLLGSQMPNADVYALWRHYFPVELDAFREGAARRLEATDRGPSVTAADNAARRLAAASRNIDDYFQLHATIQNTYRPHAVHAPVADLAAVASARAALLDSLGRSDPQRCYDLVKLRLPLNRLIVTPSTERALQIDYVEAMFRAMAAGRAEPTRYALLNEADRTALRTAMKAGGVSQSRIDIAFSAAASADIAEACQAFVARDMAIAALPPQQAAKWVSSGLAEDLAYRAETEQIIRGAAAPLAALATATEEGLPYVYSNLVDAFMHFVATNDIGLLQPAIEAVMTRVMAESPALLPAAPDAALVKVIQTQRDAIRRLRSENFETCAALANAQPLGEMSGLSRETQDAVSLAIAATLRAQTQARNQPTTVRAAPSPADDHAYAAALASAGLGERLILASNQHDFLQTSSAQDQCDAGAAAFDVMAAMPPAKAAARLAQRLLAIPPRPT